ncbi:MAG: hypothetical protein LBK61_04905 [Spirochaetaceae bacterium]|nr:hypothetical protein [Spirochaetaceae bacterium]
MIYGLAGNVRVTAGGYNGPLITQIVVARNLRTARVYTKVRRTSKPRRM